MYILNTLFTLLVAVPVVFSAPAAEPVDTASLEKRAGATW